jgi:hypothetical protein
MEWWNWVTLVCAFGGFSLAIQAKRDSMRYREFLRKKHEEAAALAEEHRAHYLASVYEVEVCEDDLDLAFRALAEGIFVLDGDGWRCRPVRFSRPAPPPSIVRR